MKIPERIMSSALTADGVISVLFGIVSLLSYQSTFGSLIVAEQARMPVVRSFAETVAVQYVVLGALCFVGAREVGGTKAAICAAMAARHALLLGFGFAHASDSWLAGNPYYDLVIQSVFVAGYAVGVGSWVLSRRKSPAEASPPVA